MRRVEYKGPEPFDKTDRVRRKHGIVFEMQVEAGAALYEYVLKQATWVLCDAEMFGPVDYFEVVAVESDKVVDLAVPSAVVNADKDTFHFEFRAQAQSDVQRFKYLLQVVRTVVRADRNGVAGGGGAHRSK